MESKYHVEPKLSWKNSKIERKYTVTFYGESLVHSHRPDANNYKNIFPSDLQNYLSNNNNTSDCYQLDCCGKVFVTLVAFPLVELIKSKVNINFITGGNASRKQDIET